LGESSPGVTPNDLPYVADPDSGPNTLYNFPLLTNVVNIGGTTWQISGYAHPGDFVEFFLADGDPSGYGEGETYLGTITVGLGGSFVAFVNTSLPSPQFTATATDSSGNTSEFALNQTGPTIVSENSSKLSRSSRFEIVGNPLKEKGVFRLFLDRDAFVQISVYDVSGELIRNLVSKRLRKGGHQIPWDLKDDKGDLVVSGVYFVRFESEGYSLTKKLVLTR